MSGEESGGAGEEPLLELVLVGSGVDSEPLFRRICTAVYVGNEEEVEELLSHEHSSSALALTSKPEQYTALHHTTFGEPSGKKEVRKRIAESLLRKAERILVDGQKLLDLGDSLGNTPLHHAAEYKRFDLVHLFVAAGSDPLAKRKDGKTPLHLIANGTSGRATKHCIQAMLRAALSKHALGEAAKAELVFELGLVAADGRAEYVLNFLLFPKHSEDNKAGEVPWPCLDTSKTGPDGLTVLHRCTTGTGKQEFTPDFLRLLLEMCGNQMTKNEFGDSLLHLAARFGHIQVLEIMEQLAREGKIENLDIKNWKGQGETALHSAVQGFNAQPVLEILLRIWKLIKLPVRQCEDFMEPDRDGRTIIDKVCEEQDVKLLEYITKIKFDTLPHPWLGAGSLLAILRSCPTAIIPLLDQNIKLVPSSRNPSLEEVQVNFSCVVGWRGGVEPLLTDSRPLHSVLRAEKGGRNQILSHPLVKLYIKEKSARFQLFPLVLLCIQVLQAVSYNSVVFPLYGYVNSSNYNGALDISNDWSEDPGGGWVIVGVSIMVLLVIFTAFNLVKEVFQMCCEGWRYWLSPLNAFQIAFIAITVMVLLDSFQWHMRYFELQVGFAACGSFFSVALLTRDMQRICSWHRWGWLDSELQYEAFVKVIKTLLKLLVSFLPYFIGLTFMFSILLKMNEIYHLPSGFLKVLSMTIGELDFDNIYATKEKSGDLDYFIQAMYPAFVLLGPIALLNLLVAFSVSDTNTLVRDAESSRLANQLQLIHSYEHFLRSIATTWGSQKGRRLEWVLKEQFFLASPIHTQPVEGVPLELRQQIHQIMLSQADTVRASSKENLPPPLP